MFERQFRMFLAFFTIIALVSMTMIVVSPATEQNEAHETQKETVQQPEEPIFDVIKHKTDSSIDYAEVEMVDSGDYRASYVMIGDKKSFEMNQEGESLVSMNIQDGQEIILVGVQRDGTEKIVSVEEF